MATTAVVILGAINDRTSCIKLGGDVSPPPGIGIVRLRDVAGRSLIAIELDSISDKDNTVASDTAAAGTVLHVLGLAHIAHQRGYGIGLG